MDLFTDVTFQNPDRYITKQICTLQWALFFARARHIFDISECINYGRVRIEKDFRFLVHDDPSIKHMVKFCIIGKQFL